MIGVTGRGSGASGYYTGERAACGRGAGLEAGRSIAEYQMSAVEHGEPEGRWYGEGVRDLGLEPGQRIDPETFAKVVDDLEHPVTGEPLGKRPYNYASPKERAAKIAAENPDATPEELSTKRLAAQRQSRQAQHAWDITPSVPKSVSVLHAALEKEGRQEEADEVMAAFEAGTAKTMDMAMRDLAYTRDQSGAPNVAGKNTSRYVRNPNWAIGVFTHRTSRDGDPQLHAHGVVVNRVKDPETGRWKTLRSPALTKNKLFLDAVFTRTVEGEITRRTGHTFATRGDGVAREVKGVDPDVRDFFSTRSRAVSEGAEKMYKAYRDTYGRDPSPFLKYQINQYVTLETRNAKTEESREDALQRWDEQLGARVHGSFKSVLAQADAERRDTDREGMQAALGFDPDLVMQQAVADMDSKSTWTRTDLFHAISQRLPDDTSHLETDELIQVMDDLTDRAAQGHDVVSLTPPAMVDPPDELKDERGRFIYDEPLTERYTTADNLHREDSLLARYDQTGGRKAEEEAARAALERHGLDEGQHKVGMDILTSDKRMHVVVGPAGTGKSRLVGALDGAHRDLFGFGSTGVTTSQNAANVMENEGVSKAFNMRQFLGYHERAAQGAVSADERERFHVPAGSPLVFDEAGTISSRDAYEAMAVADRIGAGKLILIGDEQQTDAVENAGAFGMLVNDREPHRLEEVHRFDNDWEADASRRMREGDPDVVQEYDKRGRVHGGSPEEMRHTAVSNYLADLWGGKEGVIVTGSGEEANRVSSMVRQRLIEEGKVDAEGVPLRNGSIFAGRGDRVMTRWNDKDLGVVNRDVWTVRDTHEDGSLTVGRPNPDRAEEDTRRIPAWYANNHMDLGYAGTTEATQGRTVDGGGHFLADPTTGRSRMYPGGTRSREANHFYFPLREGETAQGRMADIIATDDHKQAARTVLDEEMDRAENLGHVGHVWQSLVTEDRAAAHRDLIREELGDQADGVLEDRASQGLFRLLRQSEHEGRDPREDLRGAMRSGKLDTANSPAQALHGRITKLDRGEETGTRSKATTYLERTPEGDDPKRAYAREIAQQMDQRTTALGMKAAEERPSWTERLGEVPEDPVEREGWFTRAGHIAAYQEQYGHTDETSPIGPQPSKVEPERAWAWGRAADALGVDEKQRDIEAKSDGAVRNQIDAWKREEEWLPPNVDDRLKTAHLARDEAKRRAMEEGADGPSQERMTRQQERAERLEAVAAARKAAMEETRETREQARVAEQEWARRHPEPVEEKAEKVEEKAPPVEEKTPVVEEKAEPVEEKVEEAPEQPAREADPPERQPEPAREPARETPEVEADQPEPKEKPRSQPAPTRPEPARERAEPAPERAEPAREQPKPKPDRADDDDAQDRRDLSRANAAMAELARRKESAKEKTAAADPVSNDVAKDNSRDTGAEVGD